MGWFCNGVCRSKARLDGKTVVITGCNTGIGKYTVLDLYVRGARVVMACRDLKRAGEAQRWVERQCEGKEGLGELSLIRLDLSSLTSVRECANRILNDESHIYILINNAGVMMTPRQLTEDGYEMQFATNHLGHFLFTLILLPKIISSAPARIVNISSRLHTYCKDMRFDDINMEKSYSSRESYCRSKMANILFTKELAKRLKGTQVTVYSVHPGVVATEILRHVDKTVFSGATWLFNNVVSVFMKTPEQGAQTTLHCALEESLASETGLYYDDCAKVTPSALARKDQVASQLWGVSLDLVKFLPPHPFGKSTT